MGNTQHSELIKKNIIKGVDINPFVWYNGFKIKKGIDKDVKRRCREYQMVV